jgi:hypothetical protein
MTNQKRPTPQLSETRIWSHEERLLAAIWSQYMTPDQVNAVIEKAFQESGEKPFYGVSLD